MIYRLPAMVLAFGIVTRLIKRGGKLRHYPVWMISYLPLALIALAGLVICIDFPISLQSLSLQRWSDFKFLGKFIGFGSLGKSCCMDVGSPDLPG